MAEPEAVIAEGVLHATRLVRTLWTTRRVAGGGEQEPSLTELRRRLGLFVGAVFPAVTDVGTAEPAAPPSLLERLSRRQTSHLYSARALASIAGRRVLLPAMLDLPRAEALSRYRLLVLEQGARVDRGTMAVIPAGDQLVRDLYFLAEAAAIDAGLAAAFPRLAFSLNAARRDAIKDVRLGRRPSPQELAVAAMTRQLLAAPAGSPPSPFIISPTPEDSGRWAGEQACGLRLLPGPYRGIGPIPLWGTTSPGANVLAPDTLTETDAAPMSPGRSRILTRRPRVRDASDDEDDAEPGTWMVRADDLQEKAEDPSGLQRPADQDKQADPGELAEALSELPAARLVRRPEPVAEVLAGLDPVLRGHGRIPGTGPAGITYPEWDWEAGAYRPSAAVVREQVAHSPVGTWVPAMLRRHGALIRMVRRDFERLRPRRMALGRQPEGAELDVDALVTAYADHRVGCKADDRYYIDCRPVRRDAAIMLLIDTSASTDGWVAGDRRIIDVEKESLLVVAEALGALGDPHAMMAFASTGPSRVNVRMLKRFDEPGGAEIRNRIAGLEPEGFTRAGAAIRHATACLMLRDARHRLLLLISDGKPNDVDRYEGRYGIEDTRMAVAEARLLGMHFHCLTVDLEAPHYARRIFGRNFSTLARVERLPAVLLRLIRDLVRN